MKLHDRQQLAADLARQADSLPSLPVVTGFDGFVDEMISVVDTRHDLQNYRRIETISDFAAALGSAAGQSSLREIVIRETHPGGCAVNLGDGLCALGVPVSTYATVGDPLHAAFADYAGRASLYSWGAVPGRTLAYEFADGKLMFSAVEQLQRFHPEALRAYLKQTPFAADCRAARLIAITDWSLFPHMTACWDFLREQVFDQLPSPVFFFDLVDPSSRSEADIREMLGRLGVFQQLGEVTLGINQNEANILAGILSLSVPRAQDKESALIQAAALKAALKIDRVVLHATRYAASAGPGESAVIQGPYCASPKKSTGAGDRFNAGWVLGRILNLPETQSLCLACACSGAFVREGVSANLDALSAMLLSPWPGD